MQIKKVTKMLSAVLSAAMLVTSLPTALLAEPANEVEADEKTQEENLLKLWYDEPASQGASQNNISGENNIWERYTLPIGNSYMGANVYGEIVNEWLTFNHKTLWNGGPSTKRPDYNGGNIANKAGIYKSVVDTFLAGDDDKAVNLCGGLVGLGKGQGYGGYMSWGDIYLTFQNLNTSNVANYERNLDLSTGIANVDFSIGETDYHREYFISYPDNVLAMKLTATEKTLGLNVRFPADNGDNVLSAGLGKDVTYAVDADAGTIVMAGEMQDNQMKMNSMLKVETDGTVAEGQSEGSLDIAGAGEVIIYISADTDYKNEYPKYRTGETDEELAESVARIVKNASDMGFDTIKERHLSDYQGLFGRLDLDLGQTLSNKTTDDLLKAYNRNQASDSEKRLLEVLVYQYGRYLTIASSRKGDLPSNLQGVWQNRPKDPDWGSDYHINVNLQMNYWPTYASNLAECATPLIDYVDSLREPGRVTAECYFGIKSEPGEANGFTAHTQNTPFGWTCPGWEFSWGWSPAAVPWILQNCWEYYEYTDDKEYMKEMLYPMMKEESILYSQLLVDSGVKITLEDGTESTRLVSAPAYSPEWGPRTLGNVYENVLIWQLYEDTITASEILGVDADLRAEWKEKQSRLAPIEIGDDGQIKEWFNETTLKTDAFGGGRHRHMSHLLGLFPGDLITVENKELSDAARVSLTHRALDGPDVRGWSLAQRMNSWARIGDGETAYDAAESLLKDRLYPNLWDTHPPFQIDGNFGYTAGINEMLIQSNAGYINLLPALPDVWSEGEVNGLVARGNFEIDMSWSKGQVDTVTLKSNKGNEAVIQYNNVIMATVTDEDGNPVKVEKIANNKISFDTEEGKSYTISGLPEKEEAPANLRITDKQKDSVTLAWDAVASEGVTYNVYRQTEGGAKTLIAAGISDTSYTDAKAYDILGTLTYQVTAGAGITESIMSASVEKTEDIRMEDDRSDKIAYVGGWNDYSHSDHYAGTIKYLQSPKGTETATLTFIGGGIEVIVTKNVDRGFLEISIDGKVVETVDTYASGDLKQQVVFSKKDLLVGEHTIVVRATSTKNNNSSGTKVELDAFRIFTSVITPPELSADSEYEILATEDGRVMVQWEETENADSYKIYVDDNLVDTVDKPYAWIESGGDSHEIQIKAVVNNVESESFIAFATTIQKEQEIPKKVTNLSAIRQLTNPTDVKVSWNVSEHADRYLVWLNDKEKIFTESNEAIISGLDTKQEYTIMVFAVNGAGQSEFEETTVRALVAVSAISVKETSKELKIGEEYLINASITPASADISYRSSNENAVKVEQNGKVTAVAEGEADITIAGVANPEVNAVVHIKVVKENIYYTQKDVPAVGSLIEDANLQYKVTKSDAVNGTVIVSGVTAAGKTQKAITIPSAVKTKDNKYTFKVTAIDKNVFKVCKKKLKSVVIGENVTDIGANSFTKCKKLKSIRFMGTAAPKVGKNAFKGIKATCKIFYPKSMSKSELKKLKKGMKSAGKKAKYKAKK